MCGLNVHLSISASVLPLLLPSTHDALYKRSCTSGAIALPSPPDVPLELATSCSDKGFTAGRKVHSWSWASAKSRCRRPRRLKSLIANRSVVPPGVLRMKSKLPDNIFFDLPRIFGWKELDPWECCSRRSRLRCLAASKVCCLVTKSCCGPWKYTEEAQMRRDPSSTSGAGSADSAWRHCSCRRMRRCSNSRASAYRRSSTGTRAAAARCPSLEELPKPARLCSARLRLRPEIAGRNEQSRRRSSSSCIFRTRSCRWRWIAWARKCIGGRPPGARPAG
mmetsp:Transcript_98400/g.300901  ORF Transcript_98400/g.300901 Transcript_98400/m.300901 type:complete len:278 (+) Transcript_98400:359-1192(+)